MSYFIEISINDNLSSQDQDFWKSVSAFETESETLRGQSLKKTRYNYECYKHDTNRAFKQYKKAFDKKDMQK